MFYRCKQLLITLWLLIPLSASAQTKSLLKTTVAVIDSFNIRSASEKVFVQTDRPYYSTNDTIWMKAWVLDNELNYSKKSGLLYVELINDTGKVITSQSMPVRFGICFGQMVLDDSAIAEGSYTLRAYTNWMQNAGEQSFFTRQIYISNTSNDVILISTDNRLINKQGVANIHAILKLTKSNNDPIILQDFRLQVKDGEKILSKDNLQTDIAGKIDINFNLPEKVRSKQLLIVANDAGKGQAGKRLIIPIVLDRPENIDLQFLPEGGALVAGLSTHIGFKAIAEDGYGANISGEILNSRGTRITTFHTLHKGIGSIDITPDAGETYTARIALPGGNFKTYPLPRVQPAGINMHIANFANRDSVIVTINASPDILKSSDAYWLVAQSGGKVCYAGSLSFNGEVIRGAINKGRFANGITRFTLFNPAEKPIAERLIYIDQHDELLVNLTAEKSTYHPKDSINLLLKVTDNNNKPVTGSFALAVTDNEQIKADSVPDIKSYMLLCSGLKGTVEDPGYYFDDKNAGKDEALDNLLLTQGWVGYDWKDIFNPKFQPLFKPQLTFEITGEVSRVGSKNLGGMPVMLVSTKKPILLRDTVTDASGRFVFNNLPRIDTASFMVQVKDKKGKMFEANVTVDEFIPARVTQLNALPLKPWYINTDSTLLNYIVQNRAYSKALADINFGPGVRQLKEVIVKGRKVVKGSHFFAGYGAVPDVTLDEVDMRKANKMTIEELLKQRIKGFNWLPYPCNGFPYSMEYTVGCNPIVFYVDGFAVDEFYVPHPGFTDHYEYIKSFIGTFTAEDVRGIEEKDEKDYSIIEITTWSGNGAFMKRTHGRYLYRPIPITWPKQFYKPKYTTKSNNTLTDLRPTVYWEPNIITDTAGQAKIWFYAKGKPGKYKGIIQGSNLNGNVGTGKINFVVK